jgi:hypothetical protein
MFLNDTPLESSSSEVWRADKIAGIADIPARLKMAAGLCPRFVELKTNLVEITLL